MDRSYSQSCLRGLLEKIAPAMFRFYLYRFEEFSIFGDGDQTRRIEMYRGRSDSLPFPG